METLDRVRDDLELPTGVEAKTACVERVDVVSPRIACPRSIAPKVLQLVHPCKQPNRFLSRYSSVFPGTLRGDSSDLPLGPESKPSPPEVFLGSGQDRR